MKDNNNICEDIKNVKDVEDNENVEDFGACTITKGFDIFEILKSPTKKYYNNIGANADVCTQP